MPCSSRCPSILLAQSFTGTIIGTIKDTSGAVIPRATVTITNQQTGRQESVDDGPRGPLHVAAVAARRVPRRGGPAGLPPRRALERHRADQLHGRHRLHARGRRADRRRSRSAPTPRCSRRRSGTVGKVVDNRRILELPLNTRNVYSLIFLTPGVAGTIGNNYNSMSYTVNGARPTMMDTVIDGVTASFPTVNGFTGISVFPSVDAIQEFKVLGANYPAEYGRSLGSVLNVVYKSGTNEFHGSAYEFFRDSAFDANNYFAKRAGTPLGDFQRSQFGGVAGGPIRRGRTFFMTSYRRPARAARSRRRRPPCRRWRSGSGDFSQTFAQNGQLIRIFDPFTTRRESGGRLHPRSVRRQRHSGQPDRSGGAPGAELLPAAESAGQRRDRRAELLRDRHRRAERRQHRRARRSPALGQARRCSSATRIARRSARRRSSSPTTSPSPRDASTSRTSRTTSSSTTTGRSRTRR